MFKKKVVKLLAGVLAGTIVAGMAAPSVKAADAYYVDAYGTMHEVSADDANSTGGLFMAYDLMPNWEEVFGIKAGLQEMFAVAESDGVEEIEEDSDSEEVYYSDETQEESESEELSSGIGYTSLFMSPIDMAIQLHHMAFFAKTGMIVTYYGFEE